MFPYNAHCYVSQIQSNLYQTATLGEMDCGRLKEAGNRGKNNKKAIIGSLVAGHLIGVAV